MLSPSKFDTTPDRLDVRASDAEPEHLDLRASDAERERVAEALRDHATTGRLSTDELEQRLAAAYSAATRADLAILTADLPQPAAGAGVANDSRSRRRGRLHALRPYLAVMALLVVIWALTGAGYFWPAWPALGWGIAVLAGSRFGACGSKSRHHRSRVGDSPAA